MIIIKNQNKAKIVNFFAKRKDLFWKISFLLILLIIAGFTYYRLLNKEDRTFEDQMKEYSDLIEDTDTIRFDIKFKNYQKLLFQRSNALKKGGFDSHAHDGVFEYVSAKINYNQKSYNCKIRLKGSRKVHFRDSTKLSFRVKLKGDNTIMGMKVFSVQDPKLRNYIYEWMFHDLLKKEGFIALNYNLSRVFINGIDKGIYVVEEHFDKRLVERYGYKDGPIFKIADDSDNLIFEQTIKPFNEERYFSEKFIKLTTTANNMLHGFFRKEYRISDIINTKQLALYFAICDFFNMYHGALIKSIRMYFNPITSKFEPIGFDGHFDNAATHSIAAQKPHHLSKFGNVYMHILKWQKLLFYEEKVIDEQFIAEYIKSLKRLSSINYVNNYFVGISEEFTKNLAVMYKNKPLFEDRFNEYGPGEFQFKKSFLIDQSKYIRTLINFSLPMFMDLINAYTYQKTIENKQLEIAISNNFHLPIKIKYLLINDSILFYPKDVNFFTPNIDPHVKNYKKFITFSNSAIKTTVETVEMKFYLPGIEENIISKKVEIIDDTSINIKNDIVRKEQNYETLKKYFRIDEENNQLKAKKGLLEIKEALKISKGYTVYIDNTSRISLLDSAFILSYSPVMFLGTKSNPVQITSDHSGGVVVMNANTNSILKNIIFKNLSCPKSDNIDITGAVTFYESPVMMNNVVFKNNNSEDALNIIRSYFSLDSVNFENTLSDAFDADFSEGIIKNSEFINCGNDGIDISGSEMTGENIKIINAGDKAISAGEGSSLNLRNIKISDSEIGVTSKDKSIVKIKDIFIKNTKLGYTSFQKKSEYGSGEINVKNAKAERVGKEFLIEKGSVLKLNGNLIEGKLEKVSEMLYGNKYGKKSVR